MNLRWRWILPLLGLLLFLGETYGSVRLNPELRNKNHSRIDFWWGTFRLQTDPLHKLPPSPCAEGVPSCGTRWDDVGDVIVDPGVILETLLISGLPAFFVSIIIIGGLGRLGVNEVHSFFVVAPLLLFAWYYFLGWLLERLWAQLRRTKVVEN